MMWMIPITVLLAAFPPQDSGRFDLVCTGGGAANKIDTTTAQAWDNSGNSAQGTAQMRSRVGFADQVDLWVEGGEGRIRLPRVMLPPLRGGKDGWFELKDVKITADAITASAAVNFINKPKVRVDRRTGVISINGKAGQYTGECTKVDPSAANKF